MIASLVSIRPRFVDAIFRGEKWIELRRQRLTAESGHVLFVYETAPVMSVRGIVRVKHVEVRSIGGMWRHVSDGAGVTWEEYRTYFEGSESAFAIHLASPREFSRPLSLAEIRAANPLFHPPRTWVSFASLPLPLQVELRNRIQRLDGVGHGRSRLMGR